MPKHEFMDVRSKVSDSEGGNELSLSTLESGPPTNTVLNDKALFSIILKPGTTPPEAQQLCRQLDKYVTKVNIAWLS
jgi:hypothetical protein